MKKYFIVILLFLLYLTGCTAVSVSDADVPIGNSLGYFKYQATVSESSEEVLNDNELTFNGVTISLDSDYKLDSESDNVVLLKSSGMSVSLTVIDISYDMDLYRTEFENTLKDKYSDFRYSCNGDLILLCENGINWDLYQGYLVDNGEEYEVKGYYTLVGNKLVSIEFGVSSSVGVDAFEEAQSSLIKNTIIK